MKRKLLTGLLCALVVGPLAACNDNTSSSGDLGGGAGGGAGGGNSATEIKVQEKLADAAKATSNKLLEGLEKDLFAFKYEVGAEMSIEMKQDQVNYVVDENNDLVETGRTTLGTGKTGATEEITLVGNVDLKYYNALAKAMTGAEVTVPETNVSEFYAGVEMSNSESAGEESYSTTNEIEFYFNKDQMVIRNNEDKAAQAVNEEVHYMIASVVSELQTISEYNFDQILEYAMQFISQSMANTEYEDEEPVQGEVNIEMYKVVIEKFLGFFEGTITTEEFARFLFVEMGGVNPEDYVGPETDTIIAILDYIKTMNLHSLIDFSSKKDVVTIAFNYANFKKLVEKVMEDIADLFVQSGNEEAALMAQQLLGAKEMVLGVLPKNIVIKATFEIKNGIIVNNTVDVKLDGELPVSESSIGNGETATGYEVIITKVEYSHDFAFEFGTTAYTVPVLTVGA